MTTQSSTYGVPARRRWPLVVAGVAVVVVNAVGYLAYRAASAQHTSSAEAKQELAPEPSAKAAPTSTADGFRIAGIKALEMGDYDVAVTSFSRALEIGTGDPDTKDLLALAQSLRQRERDRATAPPETATRGAAVAAGARPVSKPAADKPLVARLDDPPARPAAGLKDVSDTSDEDDADSGDDDGLGADKSGKDRKHPVRRTRTSSRKKTRATKAGVEEPEEEEVVEEEPEPAAPDPGLLVITPTPGKLLVSVDGEVRDLSPVRVEVADGMHTVTLSYNNEQIYSKRVRVDGGQTSVVRPDLRDKIKELQPDPEPKPKPPVATPPPDKDKQVAATYGEIYVLSPNLYGEIWINGTSYGFPPRVAKKIPEGKATVEIRVQGAVRRKKTVTVKRDARTTLRFR